MSCDPLKCHLYKQLTWFKSELFSLLHSITFLYYTSGEHPLAAAGKTYTCLLNCLIYLLNFPQVQHSKMEANSRLLSHPRAVSLSVMKTDTGKAAG